MSSSKNNQKNLDISKGGPQTLKGKQVSKYNALKHGLLSKKVLLKGESKKLLSSFRENILNEVNPQTEVENMLCERVIANTWRLRRVLQLEVKLMDKQRQEKQQQYDDFQYGKTKQRRQRATLDEVTINKDLEKLHRYEASIERSIYRALHELQRIQSAQSGEKPMAPIAIDVSVDK